MYKTLLVMLLCWTAGTAQAHHLIPTVYLDLPDSTATLSRDDWTEGVSLRIVLPDGTVAYESARAEVKGRGHSTFSKPKKPYALRLDKAAPLLGMPDGKRWALLANFMDHSLMRNSLAFAIARQTALDWTPQGRFVDVVVNDRLQGCYLLCEDVRFHKNRLDLDDRHDYLLEVDAYFDEPQRFRTRLRRLPVNVKEPGHATPQQLQHIAACLDTIEALLYTTGSIDTVCTRYIDARSFADWWLVHELTQNAEPNGPRSCYLHKTASGRLKAGPVWDFDLAFITVGLDRGGDLRPARLNRPDVVLLTGDSLYNPRALWYDRLLGHPSFRHLVALRWRQLAPRFRALAGELDRWQRLIEPSALADERLWHGQDPARFDTATTFRQAAAALKHTYLYRLQSLDRLLRRWE